MKRTILILFQIVLLMMICVPAAWADNTISISVDKTTASIGETVVITGKTSPESWVPIKVLDEEKNIVLFDSGKADSKGDFVLDFKIPDNAPGILTVVVGEGRDVETAIINGPPEEEKPSKPSSGGGGGGGIIEPVIDQEGQEEKEIEEESGEALEPPMVLTDVAGHWAEKNIDKLVGLGAISGYPDGTFKPENKITRAEFTAIIVKAFNLTPQRGKVFADTADHWARDSIAVAASYGIVNGYDENTFGPDDTITREQMAVMIVKAARLEPVEAKLAFTDSNSISDWAEESMAAAIGNGIISGYPDNTVRPQGHATRSEAVTVIVNAL